MGRRAEEEEAIEGIARKEEDIEVVACYPYYASQ
jgi:hypothetical protein